MPVGWIVICFVLFRWMYCQFFIGTVVAPRQLTFIITTTTSCNHWKFLLCCQIIHFTPTPIFPLYYIISAFLPGLPILLVSCFLFCVWYEPIQILICKMYYRKILFHVHLIASFYTVSACPPVIFSFLSSISVPSCLTALHCVATCQLF